MRIKRHDDGTVLWLSAEDTYNWANRPDNAWPCSFLSGRRLFAAFDANGDLADMAIDGGKGDQDCPADEFDAITKDALKTG
jgi:hypothetical protein